ncbi:GNAT family N-acetyltransferase [Ferrovibrio sp.]|uniref:GNAT family N-acetyltransferase n=1 Tax=Ferrovibrio sp. TaxID=1917215 RepID=UPI00311DAA97
MLLPAGFSLHDYGPADVEAVRALHRQAFRALAAGHHTPAQIAAHDALVASPAYVEDLAGSNLLLARDGAGLLVATAGWLAMSDRPDTARIRKVFVHPAYSRRGLATAMVRAAETRAGSAGLPHLFVRANINAVPLYETLGYRAVEPGVMPAGTEALPVLFMCR